MEALSDLSGAAAHMTLDYHEGRPGVTKRHKALYGWNRSPPKSEPETNKDQRMWALSQF